MIPHVLRCPHCHGTDIVRHGKTPQGKQRYRCRETACPGGTFLLDYSYPGHSSHIKEQIVEMAMNASGIRDTARVLQHLHPAHVEVEICRADELEGRRGIRAELDEMWSYVGKKGNPRWLWHAIDHHTGKVLAYVFGRRQDDVFLQLQELLAPFGITKFYTDGWGAYERHLDPDEHCPGKRNTQKIERKHLTLRTRIKRLARKTICFSKSIQMHDIVIGLFVNRYEFGLLL